MIPLFNRLFVQPFYAQNAGSLLVVVLLAFGFMRPMDHEALIAAALVSPLLFGLFALVWVLYTLHVVTFVRSRLATPDYLFLNAFRLVAAPTRWLVWLVIAMGLLLPVIAYAGWMLVRAADYGQWTALYGIVAVVASLLFISVGLADYRLRHPSPTRLRLSLPAVRVPYLLFFPTYWLRREPLSLVLTKATSGLLLVGICRLYPTDDYDQRLLLIGLLLAVLFHAAVSRQVSQFERQYVRMLDNLPYSVGQRFSQYGLLYGLIWLPELGLLVRNCPDAIPVTYVALLWLTGLGWLLLLHTLVYGRDVDPTYWLYRLFAGFIVGLLAIMAGFPAFGWLALGWGAALIRNQFIELPLKKVP